MRTRPYVTLEAQNRIEKYARAKGIQNMQAYDEVIKSALDENGIPRTVLCLTDSQRKAIDEIASEMAQTPEKTAQDLINFSMLLYATPVTFREVYVYAAPLFMDRLVESYPGMAKEILHDLKRVKKVKLNTQAELRYSESVTPDVEGG